MNSKENNLPKKKKSTEDPRIDLIELFYKVYKKRKWILKVCGIAALAALIIGFSLPKEFTAEVQLAPETSDASSGKNALGGLAAIAGINLNTSSGVDAYSLDLYPDIVKSTPFLMELLSMEVKTRDENTYLVYEYMDKNQKSAWWSNILAFPFTIKKWIQDLTSAPAELQEDNSKILKINSVFALNRDQERILNDLRNRIHVYIDKKTYVVNISVKMQDPVVAALLTQEVLDRLQDYITNYRTQKAKQNLEFTEMAYEEAQQRYFEIQRVYAAFEDANRHISTATYRTEQERLKNEMTLSYNLYNSLSQQREQDRLKVQEQTPVFALIEPSKVPSKPSSPRKLLLLVSFIFVAGAFSVTYILLKDEFINLKPDKEDENL